MVGFRRERPNIRELKKEFFVADMHFHTAHSYDCRTSVKDIINKARKLGIFVAFTDHNSIGGVLEARNFKDAPIIPGIEICSAEGKELLVYFYDDKALERWYNTEFAPLIKERNPLRTPKTPVKMADLITMLKKEKCVIMLPHPFAIATRRSYGFFNRKKNQELVEQVDGVEVFNQMMTKRSNMLSLAWGVECYQGFSGGSDGHVLTILGGAVTLSKAKTIRQHLDAIKKGEVSIVGKELTPRQRTMDFARSNIRNKIQKGVKEGVRKGLHLPQWSMSQL